MAFLKLRTGYNLIKKTQNWYSYYLDYFGVFIKPWILRTHGLNVVLRPKSIDKWIAAEEFALDIYKLSKLSTTKFDQIFDIGAQIGTFSLHAAKVFPHAKIIAFEPDEDNFKMLEKNIQINNLENRVELINSAVSVSTEEKIKLYKSDTSAAGSTFVSKADYQEVNNYNFSKLLELVDNNALLKIDIEGGEKEIFTDSNLPTLKLFKYIIVEYHHFLDTHKIEPFEEFLTKNGYKFERDDLVYFCSQGVMN